MSWSCFKSMLRNKIKTVNVKPLLIYYCSIKLKTALKELNENHSFNIDRLSTTTNNWKTV